MLRINLFFSSNLNCETHLFVNVCTYSQLIRLRYCLKRTSYIHTFYIYIYMSLEECIGLCHISMYVYIRLCISLCTISGEEARDLGTSFATPLLPVTHAHYRQRTHTPHSRDMEIQQICSASCWQNNGSSCPYMVLGPLLVKFIVHFLFDRPRWYAFIVIALQCIKILNCVSGKDLHNISPEI